MKRYLILIVCVATAVCSPAQEVVLKPVKDTFGRSNELNKNNGASDLLLLTGGANIKTLIAFDLSSVTNEIISAEFLIHIKNSNETPISLVVASMVEATNNASWTEGKGALGIRGRNAQIGEATFAWRAFRDQPWESADGKPVQTLMDSKLWNSPVATLRSFQWLENEWIVVPIKNISMLEEIRNSESREITYGLWGTAGKGIYEMSSRESSNPPVLKLVVKEKEDEDI